MRYADPELRDRLAAEYVLGTMPVRARRRFEQLMEAEPEMALAVARWSARFELLDDTTPPEAPPARVWRTIERRIPASDQGAPSRSWPNALAWWRGIAVAALAALAAVVIYFGAFSTPPPATVVAVLADRAGQPAWIAVRGPRAGEVSVAAMRPVTVEAGRSLELWGIAGAKPRPLGLLPAATDRALVVAASGLPTQGGVLAVSREPAGGSPTGLPTGPVLYQGKLVAPP